jgi:ATP-dependent DNA helicase RecG
MDDQSKEVLDRFGHEESQTIEFKEALPRDLEEVLVAFTNAIGGTVLIGVTNSGQVQGLNWTQIEEERLQEHARKPIPPLSLDTELFTLANGRRVVAVKVTPLRETWAHTANGRLVVRAGPTNRVLVGERE